MNPNGTSPNAALSVQSADSCDVATMAGALIGSGLKIGLRNGITEEMLQTHFESSVQKIQKLIAQSAQQGAD